ncbi:HpcH/HpaI aldolase/citrate lyase family protein [Bacillus cereus]|uniref:HpcH/HpaI aldolase/citrate lyase family protein n=1 Tax=Bacillus cereus TaxID=1396 RepID=A0AB73UIE2_BACCE|nr:MULTISPECIES: HpcH/HpaI aldolase/citrate lyase family protein [Bacillus cereus group]MBE5096611.1 HpcH/HpaI aldolase/citrate lyase family protein [Bacillus thuringiensis]MBV6708291.1 HpcH/HpaI aldolase/citrate lyase family protein [Bacillus thuringiensis]MCU7755838.1 HpcH/HpaI aldolase/citrate lyase family protein [Bacillus cereus]MDA2623718.1 HpcH/HpaI aldolase/citrate lyase family protein [Bacillus cereus]MDC7747710.1 HpcH/HpaI aldolase/citrate lyase family protein [Bacillus cereus]
MNYFSYLSSEERQIFFYKEPLSFSKNIGKEQLAYALGATLYTPGTKETIAEDIIRRKHVDAISIILCLEDAISDEEVKLAEQNIVVQIQQIANLVSANILNQADIPLLFIRVRQPSQMKKIVTELGSAVHCLCGFVFPKFTPINGKTYIDQLAYINELYSLSLYGMPILESPEIMYKETRAESLLQIKDLLDSYHDYILNVRIGATDFSSIFSIRRNKYTPIYHITVVRDCISDIINVFSRATNEYIISGCVWEYFSNDHEEGLIQEVSLDHANGLIGKTVIHPSHIKVVQAMHIVTMEDYLDARLILQNADTYNGVLKSSFSNKMNEVKPHYGWARKTILKSNIYGVLHENKQFTDLLITNAKQHV